MKIYEEIPQGIRNSIQVKQELLENTELQEKLAILCDEIVQCLGTEGKLIICGNGGSASDALHFAGEIVGRFQKERVSWPAMVLNADVATMTAIANDYGYEEVFARQAAGHIKQGDILIGISTSGNSENVYRAILVAKEKGIKTAALLGKNGGKIGEIVDIPVVIPCENVARIQESHIMLIHIICEIVEEKLA